MAEVSPDVWTACAGPLARAPHVGSVVYYFPEGHFEYSTSSLPADLPSSCLTHPIFPCVVLSVSLLVDSDSDEAFCIISLQREGSTPLLQSHSSTSPPQYFTGNMNATKSFSKVLTPSDFNNEGGFSVPRSSAESMFPQLDWTADPPMQNLLMRDVQGKVFKFAHSYHGTPATHFLTSGWAEFVSEKKLTDGDSVVFSKNERGLHIGVRRGPRYVRSYISCSREEILNAIESASNGTRFEVPYYPRIGDGALDFVVQRERVQRALMPDYSSIGQRVEMVVEAVDSVHTSIYHGTVFGILSKPSPWTLSAWRTLQITWDDPKAVNLSRHVSPWRLDINMFSFPFLCLPTGVQTNILALVSISDLVSLLTVDQSVYSLIACRYFPRPLTEVFFLLFTSSPNPPFSFLFGFHASTNRWVRFRLHPTSRLSFSRPNATESSLAVVPIVPCRNLGSIAFRLFSRSPSVNILPMLQLGDKNVEPYVLAIFPDDDELEHFKIIAVSACGDGYHSQVYNSRHEIWFPTGGLLGPDLILGSVAIFNNALYVVEERRNDLLKFDLITYIWEIVARLPSPFFDATHLYSYDKKLYLLGLCMDEIRVWRFCAEETKWALFSEYSLIDSRYRGFITVGTGMIFTFKAVDRNGFVCLYNQFSHRLMMLDAREMTMTLLPACPVVFGNVNWYGHATEMGSEVLG